MKHFAAPEFWDAYKDLPKAVRRQADNSFANLKSDPHHPSVHFKRTGRYWSARVGLHYRALAVKSGDDFVWFWIGAHAAYDRLVREG